MLILFDCIGGILPPHSAINVIVRQQQLGDFDAVLFEGACIHAHKSGWPAAAQACFPGRSSGRWSRPNMWTPAAIAALLTMTQEFPLRPSNLGREPTKLPSIKRTPAGAREDARAKLDYDSSHRAVGR